MPQSPTFASHPLTVDDFAMPAQQVYDTTVPGKRLPHDVWQILTSLEYAIDLRQRQSLYSRKQAAVLGIEVSEVDRTNQYMLDKLVQCQDWMTKAVKKCQASKTTVHGSSSK